jgi:hypothetical protein
MSEVTMRKFYFEVIDGETKEPIENALINFLGKVKYTNKNGKIKFKYDENLLPSIGCAKAGYENREYDLFKDIFDGGHEFTIRLNNKVTK